MIKASQQQSKRLEKGPFAVSLCVIMSACVNKDSISQYMTSNHGDGKII